jgi:hypothetical protein
VRRSVRVAPAVVVLGLVAVLVGACGGGDGGAASAAPPPKVPLALVPPAFSAGELTVSEDSQARKAFTELGDNALVADGRLWQIRQAERLVATLQVATVKSKVDLSDAEQRRSIVNHILPGARQEIDVNGVTVSSSDANDKTVYVWFGRDLFQVLQVKSTKIDPEAVVTELVGFQLQSPEWRALPSAGEDEGEGEAP